jgi:dTDP-4-dehydrorhamnose reductase
MKTAVTPVLLVVGRNGQIGFELCRSLAPLGRVIGLGRADCDLSSSYHIRQAVRTIRPDVIVNAAAYTAVDCAERDAAAAFSVNGVAPGVLAEVAEELDSLLVHYSTDYVFDGRKSSAYVETDEACPLSVYGASKLAGEQAVAASEGPAITLRTSWVAGVRGTNFAKTILALARVRDRLQVVSDQHGAPTMASMVADVTAQIVARYWLHGGREHFPSGLYHLSAAGQTNWYAYALEVVRYVTSKGVSLRVSPDAIESIPASAYPVLASRPSNSCLDSRKLRETFGIHLPHWREGVHHLLDQIALS